MSPAGNSLDLNNLPEEHGKQPLEESSMTTVASADTTRFKKKKYAEKDDSAKVYECRFCFLQFCKSQALGGHMNRHREERETETLNRARQLVFSNEGLAGAGAGALSLRYLSLGGQHGSSGGVGDPCRQFRPVHPSLWPAQPPNPPSMQQHLYPSSSSHSHPCPPSYHWPSHPHIGDYYFGHVVSGSSQRQPHHSSCNFACHGAPLSHSSPMEPVRAPTARDDVPRNHTDEKNWSYSYGHV